MHFHSRHHSFVSSKWNPTRRSTKISPACSPSPPPPPKFPKRSMPQLRSGRIVCTASDDASSGPIESQVEPTARGSTKRKREYAQPVPVAGVPSTAHSSRTKKTKHQAKLVKKHKLHTAINIRWNDNEWYIGRIQARCGSTLSVSYAGEPIFAYNLEAHKEGRDWRYSTTAPTAPTAPTAHSTYKGVTKRKNVQNDNLVSAWRKHCRGSTRTHRACVIDAIEGNSTRALMKAGLKSQNITVANWDGSIVSSIRETMGADAVKGSFLMALARAAHAKQKFDVVYADYCGMLTGTQRASIGLLFAAKLLKNRSVLAITLCARTHKKSTKTHAAARDAIRHVKGMAKKNGYSIESSTKATKSHYTEPGKQTMAHLLFTVKR